MLARFILCLLLVIGYHAGWALYFQSTQAERTNASAKQINNAAAQQETVQNQQLREFAYGGGWWILAAVVTIIMFSDVKSALKKAMTPAAALLLLCNTGCLRPIEPVINKEINSHEEAFLIPYQGDAAQQQAANNEEFLKKNLVFAKQVRIPQQWIATGREWLGPNGKWHDAATLIVVDIAPVTREWTADKNSGTGGKDEAIWVMTADSIEFSTGWTVTAKIDDRDAAVKFLHNYRNGSLAQIMDSEIRAKVQADFGLEVTDLPMETLRKSATPHITKVIKGVRETFSAKGINITNIGITGGFVYKNPTISEKMVAVYNAEQEKDIAISKTKAQEEANKAVILKSQGEADAILKTKKAEADGIKMLADAKFYEIEKSKENLAAYVQLKTLELQKTQLEKWDGRFPVYYMGNMPPNTMLTIPTPK
jgi:regulator of protease activity HflC (stomatin/prohibitin superfamily)